MTRAALIFAAALLLSGCGMTGKDLRAEIDACHAAHLKPDFVWAIGGGVMWVACAPAESDLS